MAGQASANKLALVIGNSAYMSARPLPNAKKDAAAIAAKATALGYCVFGGANNTAGIDLDHVATMAAFEAFVAAITPGSSVAIFYAGHGLQVIDENYLVPIDADIGSSDPLAQFVPVRRLVEWAAAKAGPKGRVVVLLDACRENPFTAAELRKLAEAAQKHDNGFTGMTGGFGTMKMQSRPEAAKAFICYATAPGEFAFDGNSNEPNSPFTTAILRHMGTRGLSVEAFALRVANDVQAWSAANKQAQDPWWETNLKNEFAFNPARSSPVLALALMGFAAGIIFALGLFDGNRIRVPFENGKILTHNLWVLGLGLPFAAAVAYGSKKWGSGRMGHVVMAFIGTAVSYALAIVIICSQFGRLPANIQLEQRPADMALGDPSFLTYAGLAVIAAALCGIGPFLMGSRPSDPDTFIARMAKVTEWLVPLFVLIGLVSLDLFLSIGTVQVVASALIWLFAGIVVAGGSAISLKPQGGVFLGFGAATGAIAVGLLAALFFAVSTVLAKNEVREAVVIVVLGGLWFAALGAQLGYCFSFYVPEYEPRRVKPRAA